MQIVRSKFKKGRRGFLARRGVFLVSKELFCEGEALFSQQGRKIEQKGPLFAHVYEP